jgi:type IV pilus assembly PilO-like protein
MRRDFTTRKRAILGVVTILVLADLALAAYSLELSSAPRISQQALDRQARQLKLMQADIERARKIREDMPATQKDCEKFEKSLLPASSASSTLSAELNEVARKNGVQLVELAFKPTPIPERGMSEVAVDSTISGDYRNVIQFLNGLQRSANNYIVESLTLAPEGASQGPANVIKVGLHIKTYLRATA